MKHCDFSEAKVGDRVWSIARGWVEIIKVDDTAPYSPFVAKNKDDGYVTFTIEGKTFIEDIYPTVLWNEFEIPKEAFEKPKLKLEVDTLVWVWNEDESEKLLRFFSHFNMYDNIYTFDDGRDSSYKLSVTTRWKNWELYKPKNKD